MTSPQDAGRDFGELRRVVVKVGSAIIAPAGRLDPLVIERIAKDVTALRETGLEIVLVVSGAVAAGYLGMGRDRPPTSVVERQAAAAVGQYRLMTMFASEFEKCDTVVAQLLMMQDDIEDRRRFLSARHTLQELLSHGVLPIINENDPLADDEAKIGDNDHLAALVTSLTTADLLVILSTVAGVLRFGDEVGARDGAGQPSAGAPGADGDADGPAPIAEVISTIEVGSEIDGHITDDQSETGVGGMRAKVRAARLASDWGVPTVIASGNEAGILTRIVKGEEVGSLFVPGVKRLTERKRWIAIRTRSRGSIAVDDGAKRALLERGASLLPIGIVEVEGDFGIGARVDLVDGSGVSFAVGLVSYPASEIKRMKGRQSVEFEKVLGYKYVEEIVHREDLVLLDPKHHNGESLDNADAGADGTDPDRLNIGGERGMSEVRTAAEAARNAAQHVATLTTEKKNDFLRDLAGALIAAEEDILRANSMDIARAEKEGLSTPKLKRLDITAESLGQMAEGLRQVADLEDPVARITRDQTLENGLRVMRVRCPLGVVMMIYESRPNVTIDAFSLCFKSGNACILKGGKEAQASNEALAEVIHATLRNHDLPEEALVLVGSGGREAVAELLTFDDCIDLVIPRGGETLIRYVSKNSSIPTVQHFQGICHVYVDVDADLPSALEISVTGKTSAAATCNATEAVLIHEGVATTFLPDLVAAYEEAGVEVRGDEAVRAIAPSVTAATPDDWGREFLDMIVAVKVVPDMDAAIDHIHRFGSNHTDTIVTKNTETAAAFTQRVQSSCTLVNASTRFNDGFQLGMGAEIGISTSRVHAYGPMGLEELTSQRFVVEGAGHVR